MANLKFDVDKLLSILAKREADAHERITTTAQQLMEEVKATAAALPTIPPSATDLLATATFAEVCDIELGRDSWGQLKDVEIFGAQLMLNGGSQRNLSDSACNTTTKVKHGKYRALFFLIPLPGEK